MIMNLPIELRTSIKAYRSNQKLAKCIARNIKRRRVELGLTQHELAVITGKKQPHIARLERTTYGRHTINSLSLLAVALDTTVSDLVSLDAGSTSDVANPPSKSEEPNA